MKNKRIWFSCVKEDWSKEGYGTPAVVYELARNIL